MLTRQQIAADSSVQLTKNVSFCSILFCTVGRDCTEQMSGLVQDFWSFRGLQLHHQCLPEVAGRRPWKFESRHVQCFRIYQMSKNAFTLHYVSIESCFGFVCTQGHTYTRHLHTYTHSWDSFTSPVNNLHEHSKVTVWKRHAFSKAVYLNFGGRILGEKSFTLPRSQLSW